MCCNDSIYIEFILGSADSLELTLAESDGALSMRRFTATE